MTNAIIGHGTNYAIHDGADPGAFVDLAEVIDIGDPPSDTVDDVEATHLKSPGRRKEYISGLIDGGDASFMLNWLPGSDTDDFIYALLASGETRQHRITWPNGVTWTFSGYIKVAKPAAPLGDRLTMAVTVKVSGETVMA